MTYDINKDYNEKLKKELEKHLNRPAKEHEITNADSDSNLSLEALWQIIVQLEGRITELEKKPK